MALAVAFALAALIGLALGLFGSGGSMITLPVLVYVAGVPVHEAVAMSLVIVGGTSALGALLNLCRGHLDYRAGILFALSGMPGAFIGARFTRLVAARALLMLFGALMLAAGIGLLRREAVSSQLRRCQPLSCLLAGFAIGALTGFLGVGGGFLILPALVLFAGLEMKSAIGTALAVIAVNCLAGLIGQPRYVAFRWVLTLGFLLAAAIGTLAGSTWSHRIASGSLRRGFAWSIIGLGAFVLIKNLAS
jgi:uncharacterized membrane protein YfcA